MAAPSKTELPGRSAMLRPGGAHLHYTAYLKALLLDGIRVAEASERRF
jgi:hypothetical protein